MTALLVNVDHPAAVVLIVVCVLAVVGGVLVTLGASSSGRSAIAAKQPHRSGGAR